MPELMDQKIGPETEVKLDITGGKLVLTETYAGKQLSESLVVTADVALLVEVLEAKLTNPVAKEAVALVAAAIRALP